jgi:UDP-N-acetyl-D-glucosamine dehydrogenase
LATIEKSREKTVAVVGLGKIGLPLAIQIASSGFNVFGCDRDQRVVGLINSGKEPFSGEPGLEMVEELANDGRLVASQDLATCVSNSQVVIVVVPVIVDNEGIPGFANIEEVTRTIGENIKPGSLVVYETTLPVGTTRNRFGKLLEDGSGLKLGESLFLAYSPERVYSGKVFENLAQYPKLVGGVDPNSGNKAKEFYSRIINFSERLDLSKPNGVWDLGSSEAAELAKLAETTYRDVNIALANEFAMFAEKVDVDIYKVIEACNSQPFSHLHQPGVAVGGHCIPVYPHFYLQGDPSARVVSAARQVNVGMPQHAIQLLKNVAGGLSGMRIVILGLAYRGGVKEHAFSGAFPLAELLDAEGATVLVHDPMYTDQELASFGFSAFKLGDSCDAAILQTNHHEYLALGKGDLLGVKWIVDGRNFLSKELRDSVETIVIGQGSDKN